MQEAQLHLDRREELGRLVVQLEGDLASLCFVLLKGAHEDTPMVANRLFSADGLVERFEWPRLPGTWHGSGCTLASALAGLIARGLEPASAAHQAQQFVHDALVNGYRIGRGNPVPNRMFWAGQPQ
jgi:hydroxymethylpyrimidine/phosphomethylpyrimidine kinase